MRYLLPIVAIILLSYSCQNSGSRKAVPVSDIHEVIVTEVLQANSYTYLHVKERGVETWVALPSMIASVGDTYYYQGGMVMENFESKDLGRSFETVLFLEQVYSTPPQHRGESMMGTPEATEEEPHTGVAQATKLNLEVDKAEGGITIAELYAGKKNYDGKVVKIRGAVTKFNQAIMERNWVHLQDGSDFDGKFDLTVTTDQVLEPGAVITLEGKISLEVDFGFGYYYEVLMEEAKILED